MHVHVKTPLQRFIPFTITITINTPQEARHFHDKVMPKLSETKGSSPVYKALFNAISGTVVDAEDDI